MLPRKQNAVFLVSNLRCSYGLFFRAGTQQQSVVKPYWGDMVRMLRVKLSVNWTTARVELKYYTVMNAERAFER